MRYLLAILLTSACLSPPETWPPEDPSACAAAHFVVRSACDHSAADPLTDPSCANAIRASLVACRPEPPPSWRPPK